MHPMFYLIIEWWLGIAFGLMFWYGIREGGECDFHNLLRASVGWPFVVAFSIGFLIGEIFKEVYIVIEPRLPHRWVRKNNQPRR